MLSKTFTLKTLFVVASCVLMVAAVPGRAVAQPTAGLVGHWAFEEGSGTVVLDGSPNHNDGALINGAGAWVAGHGGGGGMFFNGSSQTEVRIPASASMSQFTSMTFAAWVKNAEPGRDGPIIAKEGNGTRSYWFGNIGGQFGALMSPAGADWPTIEASRRIGSVPANVWVHLAVTWDGALMRMYENGQQVGTYPYALAVSNTNVYTSIGVNSTFNNTQFHGVLDDVYMYNRALTAAEVRELAAVGTTTCNSAYTDLFMPYSSLWNNARGNWTNSGSGYYAQNASNAPMTSSCLPFDVADFEVEVSIHNLTDGGIWLRSDGNDTNGIVLITGGWGYGQGVRGGNAGAVLYFHRVVNGSVSGPMSLTPPIFTPGTDHSLRIAVMGPVYAVYVDGAATPATVLVDSTFTHGQVGLYCDQPNIPAGGSGPPQTVTSFTLAGIGPIANGPEPVAVCPAGTGVFTASATGVGPFTYQWQGYFGGEWSNGDDGDIHYHVPPGPDLIFAHASGTHTPQVTISNAHLEVVGGSIKLRCIITNACGSMTTNAATLYMDPADVGMQGGFPGRDGAHDNNDFIAFITLFFASAPAADLGSQGGVLGSDGHFDNNDFISFINLFFAACP